MIVPSFCDACGATLPGAVTTCPICGRVFYQPYSSLVVPISKPAVPKSKQAASRSKKRAVPISSAPPIQNYHILEKVGEGGFGFVYKARDRRNGQIVAIKQINLATLSMQEVIDATDSYNREITLLPPLQHKSLPHIYGHFTDATHWYIVMEYIEGETLEEKLTKSHNGRLPMTKILDLGLILCDVLAYLHAQRPSIIYRDIKPANIMMTNTGEVYLIDFGTARRYRVGQQHDTGSLGSPGYAAPEQYGKAQTTPQTDIYGLGATLQTLLTGKDPLEIRTGGIPPDCDIPTSIQRLIRQMMNSDASKRPYGMGAVSQSLDSIKKHLSGWQRWFVSPFTWLATLWGLFMLMIPSIFFVLPSYSFPGWTLVFLIALCATVGMSAYYFYKTKRSIAGKLTIKETGILINEGLVRPLGAICWILLYGWFDFLLLPVLFRPFLIANLGTLIGFLILNVSVMFVILRGLPRLLRWLKRGKVVPPQGQPPVQMPPLQQQMH